MTFKQSFAAVSALLLGVAMLLMGNGLQGTLLPVRGNLETFSYADVGILGAFYYTGFTLGCFAGPYLIARVGHIRAYLALVSLASTIVLLHAIIINPIFWWILRAVTGFCFSVLFVIIESWLNEKSDNRTRGTIFSVYMVINLTVITIGQMMLTLSDPKAFTLFAVASILVSLAGLPVAMTQSQSPNPVPIIRPRLRKLFKLSPVGFIGCFSHGLAGGAIWSLAPIFALNKGLSSGEVGLFMSAIVLGGAAGQWPLGRISDTMDRRKVILFCCICAALAGLSMSLFYNGTTWSIFVLASIYGLFAFPVYSLSVAHANDFADKKDYVETSSGLLLVLGFGSIVGPILASITNYILVKESLYYYTTFIYIVAVSIVIWRMNKRESVGVGDKVEFKDTLVSAQTLSPLEIAKENGLEQK